jgi:site-specific DNA-methyltransferase (adenine-specific)
MDFMADVPDNYYELAIVDPPYGIERFKHGSLRFDKKNQYQNGIEWDKKPNKKYFDELFRISKKQIIWGANNFLGLPPTEYFIIWDKKQTVDNFASAEFAWTNIKKPAKIFKFAIHKHNQINKIHPTQKPVALYKWLLKNYAKPGDKIFDSHVGSGSIRIACHDLGFDFEGCEIDEDYWRAQEERYKNHIAQQELFSFNGGQIEEE